MKKYIVTITVTVVTSIILTSFACYASELILIGRMIDLEEDAPYCGILNIGSIAIYEVTKIIEGKYDKGKIFIVHPCIEMNRSENSPESGTLASFELNEFHRLEVSEEKPIGLTVWNTKETDKSGHDLFYSTKVDLYEENKN